MKQERINVLIIEDEEFDVRRIQNTLKLYSNIIHVKDIVSTGYDALESLKKFLGQLDVVILDYQISGGLYGKELIKEIKSIDPTIQVIIITKMTINQSDPEFANELIENGAFWFGTKNPTDMEDFVYQPTDFILAIMNGYEKRRLQLENKKLEMEKSRSKSKLEDNLQSKMERWKIIGSSTITNNIKLLIEKYSQINTNVLIIGESGTGKELIARNIHYKSKRKFEKFVTVNCSAIPFQLIESELFGYEKGSFTDAKSDKTGLFEQAHEGTLFLDEISELPLAAQAKLLRVLETGEIDKIGRKDTVTVNVSVIAATNKNLLQLISEKQFREDLYYRLNVLNIYIPPLRERHEDIPDLLRYYLEFYVNEQGISYPQIESDAWEYLLNYSWPGNVRQLKNVAQRLVLLSNGKIDINIVEFSLGAKNVFSEFNFALTPKENVLPMKEAEEEFRRRYIKFVRSNSSTDAEAAAKLGIAPPNFHRLCKELGLK
ncbi:sigma-54-dependent transcriptional regulator [Melioribacteraceae bacterium 4301-Me]|uniref:sigma-54-dependent transcriptional regulator n=1 Tax=Pyranulibacter aquaticus TaxID=3163344 RepID=UPI0035968560